MLRTLLQKISVKSLLENRVQEDARYLLTKYKVSDKELEDLKQADNACELAIRRKLPIGLGCIYLGPMVSMALNTPIVLLTAYPVGVIALVSGTLAEIRYQCVYDKLVDKYDGKSPNVSDHN